MFELWGEREFFIDNLLVRIHFVIEMIMWTSLAPWEFALPFLGSLIFTLLGCRDLGDGVGVELEEGVVQHR